MCVMHAHVYISIDNMQCSHRKISRPLPSRWIQRQGHVCLLLALAEVLLQGEDNKSTQKVPNGNITAIYLTLILVVILRHGPDWTK